MNYGIYKTFCRPPRLEADIFSERDLSTAKGEYEGKVTYLLCDLLPMSVRVKAFLGV